MVRPVTLKQLHRKVEELVAMIRCMRDWLHFSHFPRVGCTAREPDDAVMEVH